MLLRPPRCTLFPVAGLFRSADGAAVGARGGRVLVLAGGPGGGDLAVEAGRGSQRRRLVAVRVGVDLRLEVGVGQLRARERGVAAVGDREAELGVGAGGNLGAGRAVGINPGRAAVGGNLLFDVDRRRGAEVVGLVGVADGAAVGARGGRVLVLAGGPGGGDLAVEAGRGSQRRRLVAVRVGVDLRVEVGVGQLRARERGVAAVGDREAELGVGAGGDLGAGRAVGVNPGRAAVGGDLLFDV